MDRWRPLVVLVALLSITACSGPGGDPILDAADTRADENWEVGVDVGSDSEPGHEPDSSDDPTSIDADGFVDLALDTWEASEVAVPGACAALEPDRLSDGGLLARAMICGRNCSDSECAGTCARGGRIAGPCGECIVRTAQCLVQLCPDCESDESCANCFLAQCESDWLVCAGVVAPEIHERTPPERGCRAADRVRLVRGDLLDAFEDCRRSCPASTGRYQCITGCMVSGSELAPECAECFAGWGQCLDRSDCAPCVREPTSSPCLRCAPALCHSSFDECTSELLELDFAPPDVGEVRLFNATDVFGMALVRLPSGEPLARRVPPFLPSAHTEVEAGTFEVATTAGQVGPGAPSLARAWLDVSSGSRWLVIGLDGLAVVVADGRPGPGVRSLRFFNATTSPAWVRVAANAEVYVEPGSESEPVDVGVREFMAEFGREPGTVVAQAEFPAPGPSANWIALILPSSDALLESELLVLDASGGYFYETLNPPD